MVWIVLGFALIVVIGSLLVLHNRPVALRLAVVQARSDVDVQVPEFLDRFRALLFQRDGLLSPPLKNRIAARP